MICFLVKVDSFKSIIVDIIICHLEFCTNLGTSIQYSGFLLSILMIYFWVNDACVCVRVFRWHIGHLVCPLSNVSIALWSFYVLVAELPGICDSTTFGPFFMDDQHGRNFDFTNLYLLVVIPTRPLSILWLMGLFSVEFSIHVHVESVAVETQPFSWINIRIYIYIYIYMCVFLGLCWNSRVVVWKFVGTFGCDIPTIHFVNWWQHRLRHDNLYLHDPRCFHHRVHVFQPDVQWPYRPFLFTNYICIFHIVV